MVSEVTWVYLISGLTMGSILKHRLGELDRINSLIHTHILATVHFVLQVIMST